MREKHLSILHIKSIFTTFTFSLLHGCTKLVFQHRREKSAFKTHLETSVLKYNFMVIIRHKFESDYKLGKTDLSHSLFLWSVITNRSKQNRNASVAPSVGLPTCVANSRLSTDYSCDFPDVHDNYPFFYGICPWQNKVCKTWTTLKHFILISSRHTAPGNEGSPTLQSKKGMMMMMQQDFLSMPSRICP